tara:strand:+ start:853 stop:969 length:117 start_codon:yes stop_codon:yes gene_type:complete
MQMCIKGRFIKQAVGRMLIKAEVMRGHVIPEKEIKTSP